MNRIARLSLLSVLLLALLLTGCVQEREDVLSPEGQPTGEVAVGEQPTTEVGAAGAEATPGGEVAVPAEGTVTEGGSTEGGAVTSGGGIGEAATEGTPGAVPSTPAPGEEVTGESAGEQPATEGTTVAVEGQEPVATPEAATGGEAPVEAQGGQEGAAPTEQGTTSYTIQAGDTLYSIATSYGTTVEQLRSMNALQTDSITVGQVLSVPTQAAAETPGAVPGAEPTQGTDGQVIHTVQNGEWLYAIARQYNVTPQSILDANNLSNPNLIYAGQQLLIPTGAETADRTAPETPTDSAPRAHTVRAGDTLIGIAGQYGTTVDALKAANGLTDNLIYAGQQLTIP